MGLFDFLKGRRRDSSPASSGTPVYAGSGGEGSATEDRSGDQSGGDADAHGGDSGSSGDSGGGGGDSGGGGGGGGGDGGGGGGS